MDEFSVAMKRELSKAEIKEGVADDPIEVEIKDQGNGTYRCTYTLPKGGTYTVSVAFAGTFNGSAGPCRGSPYTVKALESKDLAARNLEAAQEAQDKRYPRPDESGGFKRSVLRRLAATATQVQKRTQQARSSQYYPSLAVLVADVVEASGLDQDGDANTVAILDDTFVKFRELAEVHYQAKSLQVAGNKFCALGGVRYSTASSCIGGAEEPTPDGEPEGVMLGADD